MRAIVQTESREQDGKVGLSSWVIVLVVQDCSYIEILTYN